jgi:DNA/RNA endonuclease G (NUC1)
MFNIKSNLSEYNDALSILSSNHDEKEIVVSPSVGALFNEMGIKVNPNNRIATPNTFYYIISTSDFNDWRNTHDWAFLLNNHKKLHMEYIKAVESVTQIYEELISETNSIGTKFH